MSKKQNQKNPLMFTLVLCALGVASCVSCVNPKSKDAPAKEEKVQSEIQESVAKDESEVAAPASDPKPQVSKKWPEGSLNRGILESREVGNWVGKTGYVGAYPATGNDDPDSLQTPWTAPTYQKEGNTYVENGTIEHKTKFSVVEQDVEHTGHGFNEGYLTVLPENSENPVIIDVSNYVEQPFFELGLSKEADLSPYIAEYHQVSDEYPTSKGTADPDRTEGAQVLVTESVDDTHVTGYIFDDFSLGFGGVKMTFNTKDLKKIY